MKIKNLPIGALIYDGMGQLPTGEPRELIDIMIKPGAKFAPFEGLTRADIAIAFGEAFVGSGKYKDEIRPFKLRLPRGQRHKKSRR